MKVDAEIKLVSEFYGTFGTKFFIEMVTDCNTSVIEISETVFEKLLSEQNFSNMPLTRELPLPSKIEICKLRREWA